MHFSSEKFVKYKYFLYLCSGIEGEISNRRCISLLFRTYRKDLGNRFGIVRIKSRGKADGRHILTTYIMLCTRLGVVHSYQVVGVPIPRSASQVSA